MNNYRNNPYYAKWWEPLVQHDLNRDRRNANRKRKYSLQSEAAIEQLREKRRRMLAWNMYYDARMRYEYERQFVIPIPNEIQHTFKDVRSTGR